MQVGPPPSSQSLSLMLRGGRNSRRSRRKGYPVGGLGVSKGALRQTLKEGKRRKKRRGRERRRVTSKTSLPPVAPLCLSPSTSALPLWLPVGSSALQRRATGYSARVLPSTTLWVGAVLSKGGGANSLGGANSKRKKQVLRAKRTVKKKL